MTIEIRDNFTRLSTCWIDLTLNGDLGDYVDEL